MDWMLGQSLDDAERILHEIGLSGEKALSYVHSVAGHGVAFGLAPDAPAALRDPTHPASYAVQILVIAKEVRMADPVALQLGRLWARAETGLKFPELVKHSRQWHLAKHQGPGGRNEDLISETLRTILEEIPNATVDVVIDYLGSEDAWDRFSSTEDAGIYATAELTRDGLVSLRDRKGEIRIISRASFRERLRRLREKMKD